MSDEEKQSKDDPAKAKGGSKMIIVVAIVGVLLVAVIAVLVVFLLRPSSAAAAAPATAVVVVNPVAELGPVVDMDSFVVNVKNGEGQVYLKAAISLEMVDTAAQDTFTKWTKLMRNEVLMYLAGIDIEKSRTTKEKRQMETDIKNLMNKRIGSKIVKGVFFTEFVTQ